jgi:hypothetical protein
MQIIDFVVEIDKLACRLREICNEDRMILYGLHFDHPPAESFREIAHHSSSITLCRILNSGHVVRIMWCSIASKHIGMILEKTAFEKRQTTDVVDDELSRDAWIKLRKTLIEVARTETDLILDSVSVYMSPELDSLSTASVRPLIWPLMAIGRSPYTTMVQRARMKEALIQIGEKAKIPVATKMAHLDPSADIPEDAHLLHLLDASLTWSMSSDRSRR